MPQPGAAIFELLESLELSPELREATLSGLGWQPSWTQLATVDGWVLWLGHPPIPEGVELVPAPGHLVWDDPISAIGVAVAVSIGYAALRGATAKNLTEFLERESPVVVVIPGDLHVSIHNRLLEIERFGIPLLFASSRASEGVKQLPAFAARRDAHPTDIGRPHDPVFSFEDVKIDGAIGNNSLSSFVLHPEGEQDGITITGEASDRVAIEIGVRSPSVGVARSLELEREAARMPSFLKGVVSTLRSQSLEIGWRADFQPSPVQLGDVLHAWLKALYRLDAVHVRIVFAPEHGRSARLVDMRERARQYAEYRASLIEDSDHRSDRNEVRDERNA